MNPGEAILIRKRTKLFGALHAQGRTVDIGRPGRWGNPHVMTNPKDDSERANVIDAYRAHITSRPNLMADLESLRGKALACWCTPKPCHGDVLIELLAQVPR